MLQKLGRNLKERKGNAVAPPALPQTSGTADFNYHSHDGRYVIGTGHYVFETRWSPGPWIYNDAPSIAGIALADVNEICHIEDASKADFTTRARFVKQGSVVILKNVNGCYAALKVQIVQGEGPSARLVFDFVIKPDGGTAFLQVG